MTRLLSNAQDSEALLTDAAYRAAVDGIAEEDLLHCVNGTSLQPELRNTRRSTST